MSKSNNTIVPVTIDKIEKAARNALSKIQTVRTDAKIDAIDSIMQEKPQGFFSRVLLGKRAIILNRECAIKELERRANDIFYDEDITWRDYESEDFDIAERLLHFATIVEGNVINLGVKDAEFVNKWLT